MEKKSEAPSVYSRPVGDFLPSSAAGARVIEVRLGPSLLAYGPGFAWPPIEINALEFDSRTAGPGSLFFALPGLHTDGHSYVPRAIEQGAQAVVHQSELQEYKEGILYIRVADSRLAMSPIAAAFYDQPSRKMAVIGVTGTEGKSTTVFLIYQLLNLLGHKAGLISTVQQSDGLSLWWNPEHQTTPEAPIIQRLLHGMAEKGCSFAVVESSSHGLSKKTGRLEDVDFDVGVMTNVRHEHLEFHGSWEQYRYDKAELFRTLDLSPSSHLKMLPGGPKQIPSFGVYNFEDPSGAFFCAATNKPCFSFYAPLGPSEPGREGKADLWVPQITSSPQGNSYRVQGELAGKEGIEMKDPLSGSFNVLNVLAALLVVSRILDINVAALKDLVPQLQPLRGRMEPVLQGQPFEVLIDYAHTPSSFEAVLPPLKERLQPLGGRLIVLFGSPGERDVQKRYLQGEIAARYADLIILCDEDPRGEDPLAILEEIALGCTANQGGPGSKADGLGCEVTNPFIRGKNLFLIPQRPQALRRAFSLAKGGDLILLLGKGHENSIIYASGAIPYDEAQEAQRALAEMGYPGADSATNLQS
ncbi:MAG: UDP-N-acetylmuramyl-tripeptide synthetase [Treponema sp.]|nr:UDP-N-acetylmuramyl-tripeptide synthetase [Treponema sp.]